MKESFKNIIIGIVIAFGLLMIVASFADDEVEAPVAPVTPIETPVVIYKTVTEENDVYKEAFLNGCLEQDKSQEEYCLCTYTSLVNKMGRDKLVSESVNLVDGNMSKELETAFGSAVSECLKLYKL